MQKGWIFFDCDDTLVMWPPFKGPDDQLIHIPDPYKKNAPPIGLFPHKKHIDYLKKSKQFNKNVIVVWSAGGQPWARAVVEALNLDKYVDHILAKPETYVDDLQADYILGNRKYVEYEPEEEIDVV